MLDELMGTKLRALYQRRKGRDLFDLWLTLEHNRVDPNKVVECFNHYMHMENHPVTREQFEQNLAQKANDKTFRVDIAPLLASTVVYDADVAIARIMQSLISRLT